MFGYTPDERKNLEQFNLDYIEWFDSRRRINRVIGSSRSRKYSSADLLDAMDMIELLLKRHQTYYVQDQKYKWKLWFPYMFIKPSPGDILINETTKEEYEIAYVEEMLPNNTKAGPGPFHRSPQRSSFTGLVILKEGALEPRYNERLVFKNEKRYVDFFEWGPRKHANSPTSLRVDGSEQVEGMFNPTITWTIKRVEPGTTGKRPFDPAKECKPHVRDQYADPDYTYLLPGRQEMDALTFRAGRLETGGYLNYTGGPYSLTPQQQDPRTSTRTIIVWGQWFDNLVQFDCWSKLNYEANTLVYWFEDFMDLYSPVLIRNGVQQLLYWQRQQDQTIDRWRDDIDNRTVQYYFRTEKLRVQKTPNLMNFDIRVRVARPDEEVLLRGMPTGVTSFTGSYGQGADTLTYDNFTGLYFTGQNNYLWGSLEIQDGFGI